MLSCFPAEGLSKTSKVSSSAIVVRMDNFVTRKPEAKSKTTVYVTAKDRTHQFGGYLYKTEEMVFFANCIIMCLFTLASHPSSCISCQTSTRHVRQSTRGNQVRQSLQQNDRKQYHQCFELQQWWLKRRWT